MTELADRLPIEAYSKPVYKKCECCGRVQDIYYHMTVRDAATGKLLVGSFDLCENCGAELAKITNQELQSEVILKSFDVARGEEI